jgi:hypothetical protein
MDSPGDEPADPDRGECRDHEAIDRVARAPHSDVFASREKQLFPPHFNHVIDALADAAAVNALQLAPDPRQTREFNG